MGVLLDRIKIESKGNIPQYYKDNVSMLYRKYEQPDQITVKSQPISKMSDGYFYFITYKDESNWMQYSPIFFCDWKRFDDKIIGYAVNFNFIPFEYRVALFDNLINDLYTEEQFTGISFESMYKELLKIGYEYALVEYDLSRIQTCYRISINIVSNFLYSSYPTVKYDPAKLYQIWVKKLETRELRHQEIIKQVASDLFEVKEELEGKYETLNDHLKRFQRNHRKFGKL